MFYILQANLWHILLYTFNADIDKRDSYGKTALHCAESAGQANTVKYLLHNHANPNVKDHREEAPLHAAVRTGNVEVVEVLINVWLKNKTIFEEVQAYLLSLML